MDVSALRTAATILFLACAGIFVIALNLRSDVATELKVSFLLARMRGTNEGCSLVQQEIGDR